MGGEVEQILLLLARRRQFGEILGGDDDMAGRAGHRTLTCPLQRLAGSPGAIKQSLAVSGLNFLVEASVGAEETHFGHAGRFSCASAASRIRAQASIKSSLSVYRPKPSRIDERAA